MVWRDANAGWQTLKLKDDIETAISLDKEFAMFMESEKQRSERALRQARVLKMVALMISLLLFLFVMAGAFLLIKRGPMPWNR